jgi:adenosylcobinamide-GDP ribazoletransferase
MVTILVTLLLLPAAGPLALLLAGSSGLLTAVSLGRRLGGCTGDTLGAVQQLTEAAFLLTLTIG